MSRKRFNNEKEKKVFWLLSSMYIFFLTKLQIDNETISNDEMAISDVIRKFIGLETDR